MKEKFTAFLMGVLFAIGLGISQMSRPPKILAFLNVRGDWDPSLLVVLIAATAVYYVGYRWFVSPSIKNPLEEYLKSKEKIEARVILGASLFGIGWGLIGLCPGPAVTNVATLNPAIFVFIVGMMGGMYSVTKFID